MTFLEAKQALARKLDIDYSDIVNNGLFSDTDLGDYIQAGVAKAWDYKPWPFTQRTKTATTIATDYYDHPQDLMNGSIRLVKVGGKEFTKLSIEAYLEYLQCNPTGTERLWAENETYIFINANAYTVGDTLDLYGKKLAPTLSLTTDLLPFSPITDNQEYSGNRDIVRLAYAEVLGSEKKKQSEQSLAEEKAAFAELDFLWKPFADEVARQQQTGRPMFSVPSFFHGSNASRSGQPIGNFPPWNF